MNVLQKEWTPPFVDDGLIEVVGFKDAWHGLVLLTPNGHGTRLAQVTQFFHQNPIFPLYDDELNGILIETLIFNFRHTEYDLNFTGVLLTTHI